MKKFFKTYRFDFKKIVVIFLIFAVTGCASYKYELLSDQYKGYVVKRNDYLIPEYTIDSKNTAPKDLSIAKQRFTRRQKIVDDYYKKMGRIENQFKALIVGYPLFLLTLATAAIRLPFIAVSDFRYDHNPKYKEIIDNRIALQEKKEDERIASLHKGLINFIEKDLSKEAPSQNAAQNTTPKTN